MYFKYFPYYLGLDRLIQNYLDNAQGLPAQLTQFCKCRTPPEDQRLYGITNLLHRAVLESKMMIYSCILGSDFFLPAHPASYTHNLVSRKQGFNFGVGSQDAMILQISYAK